MKAITNCSFTPVIMLFCMTMISGYSVMAQDSTSEKQQAFVILNYINDNGSGKVDFKVFTKEGKKKIPVQYSIVNLYLNETSKWGMMGNITTDEDGGGSVPLTKKFTDQRDSLTEFLFIGSLMNDPRLEETQTELIIKSATLELSLYEEDSTRYAKAVLKEKDAAGAWVAVPEVEIAFFVKRYFSLLPIAEYPVATDEKGEAVLEFPGGLKGDSLGNLRISAKIDAHELYGTLVATGEKKWGVPVIQVHSEERLLSGSQKNAPLMLVILSCTIVTAVWGIIVYIILQLFKIKSFHKHKNQTT